MDEDKIPYEINLQSKSKNSVLDYNSFNPDGFQKVLSKLRDFAEGISKLTNKISKFILDNQDKLSAICKLLEALDGLNIDEFMIEIYKKALEDKKILVDGFKDKTIFPPINFIVTERVIISKDEDLSKWILSSEVKKYYIDKIERWKYKYNDIAVIRLIEDIKKALMYNLNACISLSIFTLIERMLREEILTKEGHVPYDKMKEVLKDYVFTDIGAEDLYEVFVEKNLYCNTKNANEFSRHISHGVKLDLLTEKTAMNMIFIYDFLQEIIVFHENN